MILREKERKRREGRWGRGGGSSKEEGKRGRKREGAREREIRRGELVGWGKV